MSWNELACTEAAKNGHLEVLIWLRDNNCPWNEYACTFAAASGHLEVLIWLHTNNCPLNKSECVKYATQNNHQHITDWLNAN